MAWFKKARKPIAAAKEKASRVPEGLWVKCAGCSQAIYHKELATSLNVCPKCGHHFRLSAAERLKMLFDDGEWTEYDRGLVSTDPLSFTDTKPYRARLEASIEQTGLKDAIISATGRIDGIDTVVAAMEYGFIGGSMGVVVGEKITRAIERAIDRRCPVVIVCCSGGVTASFAMLGDLNVAEPKALIGFAGPRVIEQTIRQKLPEGFQRSEFLLDKGMVDMVVDRRELKAMIARALRFMGASAAQPASISAAPEAASR